MTIDQVFRTVGFVVCWGLAALLGLVIFFAVADAIIAVASTGIGALLLIFIGWKLYQKYSGK